MKCDVPAHVHAVFVHCRVCIGAGKKQKLAVVILDSEVLVVACESHKPPMRICSVTIPEIERPLL